MRLISQIVEAIRFVRDHNELIHRFVLVKKDYSANELIPDDFSIAVEGLSFRDNRCEIVFDYSCNPKTENRITVYKDDLMEGCLLYRKCMDSLEMENIPTDVLEREDFEWSSNTLQRISAAENKLWVIRRVGDNQIEQKID